jgi:nucleotide-binding universal stress UspA family protein
MTWIVDLDLRPPSHGALRFAAAFARASAAPDGERFVPVHVLDAEHLRAVLRVKHLDEVVDAERELARRMVREEAASASFADVQVVQALREEEGLAAARERHGADGVIVARDDGRLVRLGRVARRLLGSAPCPVVIVPSATAAGAQLDGPVAVLTDLDDPSIDAWLFGAKVARQAGRAVIALHVVSAGGSPGAQRGASEQDVLTWTARCGVGADRAVVARGDVVEEALAFADAHRTLLLVAGSRRHGWLERAARRSLGHVLASRAARPVAIVPSSRAPSEQRVHEPAGAPAPLHA